MVTRFGFIVYALMVERDREAGGFKRWLDQPISKNLSDYRHRKETVSFLTLIRFYRDRSLAEVSVQR